MGTLPSPEDPETVSRSPFMLPAQTALTVLLTLTAAAPAWAVNKCIGPGGQVTFQDAPCAGQGERMDVKPATGAHDAAADLDARVRLQRLKQQGDVAEAIRRGQPQVGMTEQQLKDAMGEPTTLNANNYGGRIRNQHVYQRPGETWYVYTQDGVVQSIQHRPKTASASSARRCPSRMEIEAMETRASSISLSDRERAALQRELRDMRNCGR